MSLFLMEQKSKIESAESANEVLKSGRIFISEPEDLELLGGHSLPVEVEQEIKDGKAYGLLEYTEDKNLCIRVKNKKTREMIHEETYDWTEKNTEVLRQLEQTKSGEITKDETEYIKGIVARQKYLSIDPEVLNAEIDKGYFLIKVERDKNSGNITGVFLKHRYQDIEYFFDPSYSPPKPPKQ